MCGIVGIYHSRLNKYSETVEAMVDSIRHRGPDGSGVVLFDNCTLGHVRLSIVDLEGGKQPMLSTNNNECVVFNGEIYGYKNIKESIGDYKFKSSSDTELLLALYEKHGTKMAEILPGMFSFAIYDKVNKKLFCARDRFGEKPFYYAIGIKGEFIFGSEIKAIIDSKLIEPILNRKALNYYLKHLYVHPQETIYSNVFVLKPGHFLVVDQNGIHQEKYWKIPSLISIGFGEACEQFRNLLDKSVKNQLVADVPVGVLLSGGLDSSTIVGLAAKYTKKLNTFSFGFDNSENELPYAREIANKYSTNHHEFVESSLDVAKTLLDMATVYDEPFADSSNIPTYLISRLTKKYCTVALGGDGGDEMLLGYDWYKKYLGPKTLLSYLVFGNRLSESHDSQNKYFSEIDLMLLGSVEESRFDYGRLDGDWASQVQKIDCQNYLVGDILVKTDRAAMATALELRSPFLDKDLSDFCLSLPTDYKMRDGISKYILRKSCKDLWTKSIIKRKKQGFGSPVHIWMRDNGVIDLKHSIQSNKNSKVYKLFNKRIFDYYLNLNDYKGWILLSLALWAEKHDFKVE